MEEKSKERIQAFVQHILQQCEKEGLSIREVERLPQVIKFAIADSVSAQINDVEFRYQIPTLQESCSNDDCSHL